MDRFQSSVNGVIHIARSVPAYTSLAYTALKGYNLEKDKATKNRSHWVKKLHWSLPGNCATWQSVSCWVQTNIDSRSWMKTLWTNTPKAC